MIQDVIITENGEVVRKKLLACEASDIEECPDDPETRIIELEAGDDNFKSVIATYIELQSSLADGSHNTDGETCSKR